MKTEEVPREVKERIRNEAFRVVENNPETHLMATDLIQIAEAEYLRGQSEIAQLKEELSDSEKAIDDNFATYQRKLQKRDELLKQFAEALIKAKKVIQDWHDFNDRNAPDDGSEAWKIYERMAPEMKPITEVLTKYENRDK